MENVVVFALMGTDISFLDDEPTFRTWSNGKVAATVNHVVNKDKQKAVVSDWTAVENLYEGKMVEGTGKIVHEDNKKESNNGNINWILVTVRSHVDRSDVENIAQADIEEKEIDDVNIFLKNEN